MALVGRREQVVWGQQRVVLVTFLMLAATVPLPPVAARVVAVAAVAGPEVPGPAWVIMCQPVPQRSPAVDRVEMGQRSMVADQLRSAVPVVVVVVQEVPPVRRLAEPGSQDKLF